MKFLRNRFRTAENKQFKIVNAEFRQICAIPVNTYIQCILDILEGTSEHMNTVRSTLSTFKGLCYTSTQHFCHRYHFLFSILLRRNVPQFVLVMVLRVARLTTKCFPQLVRRFHESVVTRHGHSASEVDASTAVRVTFIDRDGNERPVAAPQGKSVLEIAHANEIDLEGACEGSLACSTCHVYLDQKTFESLDEPCDDENDMLDLAFGLTEL